MLQWRDIRTVLSTKIPLGLGIMIGLGGGPCFVVLGVLKENIVVFSSGLTFISIGIASISTGIAISSRYESERYRERESHYLFEEKIAVMYGYRANIKYIAESKELEFILEKINRDLKAAISIKKDVENKQKKALREITEKFIKESKNLSLHKDFPGKYKQLKSRLKELS